MAHKIRTLERFAICYGNSHSKDSKKTIDNTAYQFMKNNNHRDKKVMKQLYEGFKEMYK